MHVVMAVALWGLLLPATSTAQAAKKGQEPGYSGVVPGGQAEGRKPRRLRPNRLTWVGFQPRSDGSARLFAQLTSEVSYSQELRDGVLVVKLERVRFHGANIGRRLDMRYFQTPLAQVTSKRVRKRRARRDRPARTPGVELRIEFKNAADAREAEIELRAEEDGYHYLYLDFGPPGVSVSDS